MKFSAELMALAENESSGKSSADNYLRYTKLESGKPVNFALLDEDPLEYWLVWGEAKADGSMRPFRFLTEPSEDDIEAEFGPEFTQCLNYERTGPQAEQVLHLPGLQLGHEVRTGAGGFSHHRDQAVHEVRLEQEVRPQHPGLGLRVVQDLW